MYTLTTPNRRTRFIRGVMEREQLFITDVGKSLEQQARANLAHELQLTSVGLLLEGPMGARCSGCERRV